MRELWVYLSGVLAGRLILKDNGNLQFRYEPGYEGPPLSQSLPIQTEAHPHRICIAVFGGLLPEGEARQSIARNAGVSVENYFALLEKIGGDCAGAITLLPPDVEPNWGAVTQRIDEGELDGLVARLPQRPLAADPTRGTRLSLAGAQPKLPVILDAEGMALPLSPGAATTHIIKPEPEAYPGLVDNEAFCMELAHSIGLPVASVTRKRTVSGRPYLLVERFDRDLSVTPARRLHQEDFCQALGRPSERKYQSEGGPSLVDCFDLVREAVAVPARDISALWRLLVFNYLIGNCDAHGKNFSLLRTDAGVTLAPFYDLLSTAVYPDLTHQLAMSIGGATAIDDVELAAWRRLAAQVGVNEGFAIEQLGEIVAKTLEEAGALLAASTDREQIVAEIVEGIRRRAGVSRRGGLR